MACASKGLIVGGGLAGLTAAISLSRAGVKSDVLELYDSPTGASLGLSGRAADALAELGVYEAAHDTGRPFTPDSTAIIQHDATGKMLSAGPKRPAWPGAKTAIGVYRPVFLNVLADEAKKLGVNVEKGVTIDKIEDRPNSSLVRLSNGEQREYDFVIGADGIGSRTRELVFPDAPKPAYAGQISIRWMIPGPALPGEGWYISSEGRIGFYYLPHQRLVYSPSVIDMPEWRRMSREEIFAAFNRLLDSFTASAIVELRKHLRPDSDLICRPFEWIFVPPPWHRGHTLLIGDAAHATTAHMGMGGGMAVEDSAVLGQCFASAQTVQQAFESFMTRRLPRVSKVVNTSVELSRLEQQGAPISANVSLLTAAFAALAEPY